jgi:hypothetical protein
MVRFLERYGYPASYTTSDSIDRDPTQLRDARAVMDVGHSEYWSGRDARAFAAARDRGSSLIFLSSDTMAWRVRFAPASAASSQAAEPGHTIVAYREHAGVDPDRSEPTGPFPLGGQISWAARITVASPRAWRGPGRRSTATTHGRPRPAVSLRGCLPARLSPPPRASPASSATSWMSARPRRRRAPGSWAGGPACAWPEASLRRFTARWPRARCTRRARARSCSRRARSAGSMRSRPCPRPRPMRRRPPIHASSR